MILKTEMMPHQSDAFAKVSRHKVGALFMDMGTGKSRVALELIRFYRERGVNRCVWVCPVNTIKSVQDEIAKHSDRLSVCVIGTKKFAPADICIVGTESISQSDRMYAQFREVLPGALLLVDESHCFKSPFAMRTKRLMQDAKATAARYLMTGTQITKGIEDLFCQFYVLSPAILGYANWSAFAHYHLKFDPMQRGRIKDRYYSNYVTTKISPYVYQVKKSECLALPEKTYSTVTHAYPQSIRAAYEKVKQDAFESENFSGMDSGIFIYKLLSDLQKVASGIHPKAIDAGRVITLLDTIERAPEDAKIIVWAKYSEDVRRIVTALSDDYGSDQVCQLNGDIRQQDRHNEIHRFRHGARFMVANPATGGIGLTLNEASYVIFYSQSFKYAERMQAEDRCHRIGQKRNVHYVTIESNLKIDMLISDVLARRSSAVEVLRKEVEAIRMMTDKKQAARAIKKLRGAI